MDFDKLLGDECCLNVVNNAEKNIREALLLWWVRQDLNLCPLPCRGSALPLSYTPYN